VGKCHASAQLPNSPLRPTFNKTGWTSDVPNQISLAFIEYARFCNRPILDIGAAFGVASIPALMNGARVVVNDLDLSHLQVLREAVPVKLRDRVMPVVGRFPEQLQFIDAAFDAIHASNVLHFLPGVEFERSAAQMYRWLSKGGRVFIQTGSPYVGHLQQFIPLYEERRAAGLVWPGEFDDVPTKASEEFAAYLPSFLNLVDPEIL
jgi:SAM-dependent methyltransferase